MIKYRKYFEFTAENGDKYMFDDDTFGLFWTEEGDALLKDWDKGTEVVMPKKKFPKCALMTEEIIYE